MLRKLSSGQGCPFKNRTFGHVTSVIGRNVTAAYLKKISPGLLYTPAKFERNSPDGHRVKRKRKCGAHRAGGARYPPIYKQEFGLFKLFHEAVSTHI